MSDWFDPHGEPMGEWVVIDRDQWQSIMVAAGGYDALSVFSSLTDPDGLHGPAQVYTAWGRRQDAAPLTDIANYKDRDGATESTRFRKYVLTPVSASKDGK